MTDFVLKLYSLEINRYPCIFEHWYMYFKLRKIWESKPSFFRVDSKREKACFRLYGSSNQRELSFKASHRCSPGSRFSFSSWQEKRAYLVRRLDTSIWRRGVCSQRISPKTSKRKVFLISSRCLRLETLNHANSLICRLCYSKSINFGKRELKLYVEREIQVARFIQAISDFREIMENSIYSGNIGQEGLTFWWRWWL